MTSDDKGMVFWLFVAAAVILCGVAFLRDYAELRGRVAALEAAQCERGGKP